MFTTFRKPAFPTEGHSGSPRYRPARIPKPHPKGSDEGSGNGQSCLSHPQGHRNGVPGSFRPRLPNRKTFRRCPKTTPKPSDEGLGNGNIRFFRVYCTYYIQYPADRLHTEYEQTSFLLLLHFLSQKQQQATCKHTNSDDKDDKDGIQNKSTNGKND